MKNDGLGGPAPEVRERHAPEVLGGQAPDVLGGRALEVRPRQTPEVLGGHAPEVLIDRREVLRRVSMMLGFAVSGSTMAGVLAGCSASTPKTPWTPVALTPVQAMTMSAMVDHLLPKSSTPGAVELGVDRFIDGLLKDFFSSEGRQTFAAGLDAAEADAQRLGATFAALTPAQKDQLFQKYEASSPAPDPTVWGAPISEKPAAPTFYRQFKELALVGYFTSETVGKTILRYDPVPGRFDGCIPLADVGNLWTES